ncbi:cache domain-containing sensor histidine kinase [Paenibacillus hamazuiensis]|uniref:cache domain-containing sensor histidine kinase n=1 Tax=Paenibacillus hamazuiensis TaxID=2936508 RepID=UPI00200E501C|nr:sensor histidine kinase [Paenibacillus hamazuiensis]
MKWLKRSLFAKLLVGMLISAVIPYSLFNVFSYKSTSDSVENQVIELNQNLMDVNMDNVKKYLNELSRLSVSFYQDQTLLRYLRASEISPLQMLYIKNQVDAIYNLRPEFRAVRFMSAAVNGLTLYKMDPNISTEEIQNNRMAVPRTEDEGWGVKMSYEAASLGREDVLAMHKLLIDYPSPKVLGVVSLYVGLGEIKRLIQSQSGPYAGDAVFLYIRGDNQLLYSSENKTSQPKLALSPDVDRGAQDGELHGVKGVFIYVKTDFLGLPLTAVKFVPRAAIDDSANRTLHRSLAIQLIAIGFVIVFAFILSFVTIAPIKRLLQSIARVETGNFNVNVASGREDELGVLELRFQTMIRSIDDLMNREYRNRLELTTAQLKMLQAQINPHFLYNTLQSIGTLALRHGSPEISDKIAELGAILRYSMDLKTEVVPLQKEVEHVQHYLSLQAGRFKNKLAYTLSIAENAYPVHVPKLILQPLVENSIVHGFERGRGLGTLHVAVELDDELRIRVIDNGKGMSPEQIARIRREYLDFQLQSGQNGGIGLVNVLHRCRLFFGPGFEWDMFSTPYEETVIALHMKPSPDLATKEEQDNEGADSGR